MPFKLANTDPDFPNHSVLKHRLLWTNSKSIQEKCAEPSLTRVELFQRGNSLGLEKRLVVHVMNETDKQSIKNYIEHK